MSKNKFVNNKFVGKIGENCASDYYTKMKYLKTKSVKEQMERTKEILGVEEIDGVQFVDEFWTKIFIQNDEDEYCGGIKLILNKDDSLYSETNISQTLERMASDILKKDTKKNNPEKIKVYHSVELYEKAMDEHNELKRLGNRSTSVRYGVENGCDDGVSLDDLKTSLLIDVNIKEDDLIVLANLMNYKLEKKIDTIKDNELHGLNELYKIRFPIVDIYYQAYIDMKNKYINLTQNPKELWENIKDSSEKSKARFKKLTNEERKLKRQLNRQKHLLREDFINCIYAKTRFILFKAPLKDEGYPSWDEYDDTNIEHLRYALQLPRTNDLQTDTGCIAYDLDITIRVCEFTEVQYKVLKMYRKGMSQEEIGKSLDMKQQLVNQYINTILKKISNKNWELLENVYYLNICKGNYIKCSQCNEIKLVSQFDKNGSRGYMSMCKQCRKK